MLRKGYLLFILAIHFSCSQYSNKKAAVKFHSLNAKYNAIWQAKRLEQELLKEIQENEKDNYSYEVSIIRDLGDNLNPAYQTKIDSIIYKASLVIQRHANSNYIDDAYFLIGKARVYQKDYPNAVETFKYVNAISKDQELQLNSLIQLYFIYIKQNEITEAERIKQFILEFDLKDYQKHDYFLYLANQYQEKGDFENTNNLLREVIATSKDSEEIARLNFILAQNYFLNSEFENAIESLNEVIKNTKDPEKLFEAQLIVFQIKEDINALKNLLKEPKYDENHGKIYGTIGQIYAFQGDYRKAEEYWAKGTSSNQNKGELYLQIAQTQAQFIGNFKKAIAYYDSAANALPSTSPNYEKTVKINSEWKNFGQLLNSFELKDSLLKLSYLSEEDLNALYQESLKVDTSEKTDLSEKKITTKLAIFTRRPPSNQQQSFYFYNDPIRIQGSLNFRQKFGDRKLEDYWNRKIKMQQSFSNQEDDFLANSLPMPAGFSNSTTENTNSKPLPAKKDSTSFEEWKKDIPKTEEEKLTLEINREKDLFNLAKFALENLGLKDFAGEKLKEIIQKNANSSYEAEIYYLLYTMDSKKNAEYKNQLAANYPGSHFLSLIKRRETGVLSETNEIKAQNLYEEAFSYYKTNQFAESFEICLTLERDFPNSKFEDKIIYLKALNKYSLNDSSQAKLFIQNLLDLFPQSSIIPNAKEFLNKLN